MIEQMQQFEIFKIQAADEATNATLESQKMVGKMKIGAQERATNDRIEAEKMMRRQKIELEMLIKIKREEFQNQLMELKENLRRK